MNHPDVDQALNYARKKLSQGSGYDAYLKTFDTFDGVAPFKAIAGAGSGLFSLLLPLYTRAGRDNYPYSIARGPAVIVDVAGFVGAAYMTGFALSSLPPEVNNYLHRFSSSDLLALFTYTTLASKVSVNMVVHSGVDLIRKKIIS